MTPQDNREAAARPATTKNTKRAPRAPRKPNHLTVVTVTANDLAALNPEIEAEFSEPAIGANAEITTEPAVEVAEAAGPMTALEVAHEAARQEYLAGRITRGGYYKAVKALRGEYRDTLADKKRADKFESLRVISEAAYAEVAARGGNATAPKARTKQADLVAKITAKIAANEAANAKLKADLAALVGTLNDQSGVPV
jgi:hypothetical protein